MEKKNFKEQADRVLYYAPVDMCITVCVCIYIDVHKLVIHVSKTLSRWQTRRRTHRTKTFSQISRIWVPLTLLDELELPGQHKPNQGEESGTQPSSCACSDSSSS